MVEIIVALMTAGALLASSGYAFGAARRRRAIRELLEIREGLQSASLAVTQVDKMIKKEIRALKQLGDPWLRWITATVVTCGIFTAATIILVTAALVLPEHLRSTLFYTASIPISAVSILGAIGLPFLIERTYGRRGFIVASISGLVVALALMTAALTGFALLQAAQA